MIKLTRVRTPEKVIPTGLRGAKLKELNIEVLKLKQSLGDIPSKKFKSTRWKPAKKQLQKESHNKCAYCESDTKVVAHGDVEHFRPKNVYWWLAYCYDNYLYSCQICNQTFKSNRFPISGGKLRGPTVRSNTTEARLKTLATEMSPDPLDPSAVTAFEQAAIGEDADLIDPYITDPEPLLVYEPDDDARELTIKIAPGSPNRAARQKALEKVYGLNREELKKVRYQDYRTLKTLRRVVISVDDDQELVDEVKAELRNMTAGEHRFAGMSRYFVHTKWKLDLSA